MDEMQKRNSTGYEEPIREYKTTRGQVENDSGGNDFFVNVKGYTKSTLKKEM